MPAHISPATWRRVDPLLDAALDLEGAERRRWLEDLHGREPELAPLVATLLATHERAERSQEMETVPPLAPPPPASSPFKPGEPIGPFRLVRPLGRGGMGEVWLAEQADGRVRRQVALKLPDLLGAGSLRAERFARERDILAKLEHPHIARFLDAGVTQGGQPYLAMELVEGEPLDAYLRARSLPVPARLAFVRQVLEAVAHAHRRLVVHRDLKPANILVDAAGQVKLLDFGIAKLVGDEPAAGEEAAADITRVGGRLMTLRYAAPEQAEGGDITTATDVYSLGVVLHEALTGLSPYRPVREGRALTAGALASAEIARPSALVPAPLARELSGDLDAIVLKALRRDPAQRYPTVEAFDEDLRRHLEHRPVRARAGTWRYLAGRFALRHRLPLAMAAAVLTMAVAGVVLIDRERRVAVAERTRAETHFASVRKLANTFIFDVHGEIETLPGSLKAREMLVKTSLEYLDALAAEAAADANLQFELASAYRRIAGIQGQVGAANTGDLPAAIRNFEKAKRMHVTLDAARPKDIATVREHTTLSYVLARAYAVQGDPRWQAEIAQTVDLAARVAALPGATSRDRARVPGAIVEQAHLTSFLIGQTPEAEALAAKAVTMLEALAAERPDDPAVLGNLASTYHRAAEILTGNKRTATGIQSAIGMRRKALALFDALREAQPDDQRYRLMQLEAASGLANDHLLAGEIREAVEASALARRRNADFLAADPTNSDLVGNAVAVLALSSTIARQAGELPRAIREGREALAFDARLPGEMRQSREARIFRADAQFHLGSALLASAQASREAPEKRLALLREARPLLADAVAFIAVVRAEKLGPLVEAEVKEREDALKACDEAIRRLSPG